MESLKSAAVCGFNDFLREHQATPGEARLTTVLFDDEYLLYCDAAPIAQVLPLNSETYVPRNSTALLDAIGRTMDALGERLSQTPEPERPGKVIIAILTDGLENASEHFTWKQIAEKIRHQRNQYSWEFLFLGANQDAIATAAQMNISADNSATFAADHHGYGSGTSALSRKTRAMRMAAAMPAEAAPDLQTSMSELVREEDQKRRKP